MPASAEMVSGERSKYAEVTEPGRDAQAFLPGLCNCRILANYYITIVCTK